jgi:hypothetical protein
MKTKYLVLNDGSQWKIVEEIHEHLPYVFIAVLPLTFIIEAIYFGDAF